MYGVHEDSVVRPCFDDSRQLIVRSSGDAGVLRSDRCREEAVHGANSAIHDAPVHPYGLGAIWTEGGSMYLLRTCTEYSVV